jgi:protein-disulfide isomerase
MRATPVSALMVLALVAPLKAQGLQGTVRDSGATSAELERIRADLDIVKSQLAQVLRLLSQRSAQGGGSASSGSVRTSVADAPSLGRAAAPVTVVEFSDYQCPFCRRFFETTLPALKREYIDSGKVRYVFRDFPLDQLHSQARKAAEAAHCAGEQGRFWDMHDRFFQSPNALVPPLAEHARAIGLDEAKFTKCVSSGRYSSRVERGLADGAAAGVLGTPGFVIGRTTTGDVVEGTSIRGAQSLATFRRIIDQILARHSVEPVLKP